MARRKRKQIEAIAEIVPPTPEQIAKGGVVREVIIHAETFMRATVHINRGGTPIARWTAAGKITDNQAIAIAHCQRLWRLAGVKQKLIANYGERIAGNGNSDALALQEIEARDDLHRIAKQFPRAYWNIFERVCRFNEPAGVAGSDIANNKRSSIESARIVVCLIADMIYFKENLSH